MRSSVGLRCVGRLLLLAILALGASSRAVAADDPPAPAPGAPAPAPAPPVGAVAAAKAAAETRMRLSTLKDRVSEWCRARQELKIDCPNCAGSGAVRVGRFLKQCSMCFGAGKSLSQARFQQVHYLMYSPDFRKLEVAKSASEALWLSTRKDIKNYRNLGSYRLDTYRLVDDRHGYAVTFENGDSVPRESRWVYATEPTSRKTTWFLWRAEADGAWTDAATAPGTSPPPTGAAPSAGPGPGVAEAPPEPTPEPVARAMDEKLRVAIVAALSKAKIAHTVEKVSGDASIAIVTLIRGRALSKLQWKTVVDADVIAAARAAFTVKGFDALHIVTTVPAKNAFGAIEHRPRSAFDMSRETFSKIDFTNLSLAEAIRLFHIDRLSLGDWTAVEEDPKPDGLSLDQDGTVATALAGVKFPHKIRAFGRYADVLVVRLGLPAASLAGVPDEDAAEAQAGPAAVEGALALLPPLKEWAGVRFEFGLPYRDAFGKIEERVHYVAFIARARFDKLKIDNLTVAEIFTHFEIDRPVLTGLVYWPR